MTGLLKYFCLHELIWSRLTDIEIVINAALRADELGENYAQERGYRTRRFFPDWKLYGKAARPLRNKETDEYADGLIVFWDGES